MRFFWGAGGDLYNERGKAIRYQPDGSCTDGRYVFGGSKDLTEHLRQQDWKRAFKHSTNSETFSLTWPSPGGGQIETGMLQRAQGCLLGQFAGDALGGLVEFKRPEEIKRLYPDGVCDLNDGGTWGTLAGQPTDDSEMARIARLRPVLG